MVASDEWILHHENYSQYGIGINAASEKRKKNTKKQKAFAFSSREKSLLLLMILIVGVCCIAGIFIQASTSTIKYNINNIQRESTAVQAEIDNLNVQIKGQNSINTIEDYAKNQLGLIYPTQDDYVYVSEVTPEVDTYIAQMKAEQKGLSNASQPTVVSVTNGLMTAQVLIK